MTARNIYRLLLRLHPPGFRQRFAEEMLWIFDQTIEDAGVSGLLVDAALSLLKQHMAVDTAPRYTGRLFQEEPADMLHAIRFLQAGAVASLVLIAFFSLLQESVPLPETPGRIAIRKYVPDVCADLSFSARTSERHHRTR